jgi:adenylate cyclase
MKPAAAEPTLRTRQTARIASALRLEKRRGIRIATQARLVALAIIMAWALWLDPARENVTVYAVITLLAANGLVMYGLSGLRLYRPWMLYALVLLDHALIGTALVAAGAIDQTIPPAVTLRSVWFSTFFLFIAGAVLAQMPGLVVWSGLCASVVWTSCVLWVLSLPGSFSLHGLEFIEAPTVADVARVYLHPGFVDVSGALSQVLLLLLVSMTLAAGVRRSQMLMERQVVVERERANLARYFSPELVDRLASAEPMPAAPHTRPVAVLFADLMGFTRLCEGADPAEVMALLRGFRQRMERCVFEHGGTLDKYIGDSVMATFGILSPSAGDAASALACARAMVASIKDWNVERAAEGRPPLRIATGLHYGPVILGDIGGDRLIEFTVVGDTVNVASRLETLCRDLDADLVVSDEAASWAVLVSGPGVLEGLERVEPMQLRGRDEPVTVWTHRAGGVAAIEKGAAEAV